MPGRTAEKRISRWLAEMEAEADRFADEKGRDAFAFDPIESRYLEATPATLQIQTPYSRTVVNEIREIPHARWDADRRLARMRERRRKRYPVPADDAPPSDRAIGTHVGVVFFLGTDGELADPATVTAFYFPAANSEEYVWASWRLGSLEELVTTWPPNAAERARARTGLVDT